MGPQAEGDHLKVDGIISRILTALSRNVGGDAPSVGSLIVLSHAAVHKMRVWRAPECLARPLSRQHNHLPCGLPPHGIFGAQANYANQTALSANKILRVRAGWQLIAGADHSNLVCQARSRAGPGIDPRIQRQGHVGTFVFVNLGAVVYFVWVLCKGARYHICFVWATGR